MPSSIRKERSLCARIVSSAMESGSQRALFRLMPRSYVPVRIPPGGGSIIDAKNEKQVAGNRKGRNGLPGMAIGSPPVTKQSYCPPAGLLGTPVFGCFTKMDFGTVQWTPLRMSTTSMTRQSATREARA